MTVELEIQRVSAAPAPDDDAFRRWVGAALAGRRETAELTVRIVDEAEGRALNARWRGRDHATNVLSFPAELPPGVALPLLGDLVVCAPVVAREAAEQGKAEADHWAHLVIHGTLHLLGFDHETEAEATVMEDLERALLAGLGIGDPYAI
ncbi:MAG: rRNA maturation RNase YbeY [Pseudomonadales bacterium]|nr:rRNA maturation RNase YbeY [Pseudomonadales bacterium]